MRLCLRFSANKSENRIFVRVLHRAQHAQEADGEPGVCKGVSEVHAGEEERVLRAPAAVGGLLDVCVRELGGERLLYACVLLACHVNADVADAEGGEAEVRVVRVAEDLLEVPGARAGAEVGGHVVLARLRFDAELGDDGLDAALEDAEVVDDGEHGEAVRGGVRVHAAAEGEREWVGSFAVLAEALEHGAGGRILFEKAADDVRPGPVHGLEAVEEAQVLGGEEGRLYAGENVLDEVGVEALHVCVRRRGCVRVVEVHFLAVCGRE